MSIILLRHGQTTANVGRILDTVVPGHPLTELGEEQARKVGAELAQEYPGMTQVWHSPALRARQTAQLAASTYGDLVPEEKDGIQEISAGNLEGDNSPESLDMYFQAVGAMMRQELGASVPGGEDFQTLLKRYQPVLEEASDTNTVLVSHGAAIRTMACLATGVDPRYALHAYVANCRYVVLEPSGRFGQWGIHRWADGPLP